MDSTFPQNPYPISIILSKNGDGVTVTATNNNTSESGQAVAAQDGSCIIDLADPVDFPGGYQNGDKVLISAPGFASHTLIVDTSGFGQDVLLSSESHPFNAFDWPYTVKRIMVTPGSTNQATGEWVPEMESEISITAHVSDVSQKELQFLDPGIIAAGVRKMTVDTSWGLQIEDRIKIHEDLNGSDISEWMIHSKMKTSNILSKYAGIQRDTYILKRKT